jgi:hypothetical protein
MIKVTSLFSQLLHHFPRSEFQHLVAKHRAEYKAKRLRGVPAGHSLSRCSSVTWPMPTLYVKSATV